MLRRPVRPEAPVTRIGRSDECGMVVQLARFGERAIGSFVQRLGHTTAGRPDQGVMGVIENMIRKQLKGELRFEAQNDWLAAFAGPLDLNAPFRDGQGDTSPRWLRARA